MKRIPITIAACLCAWSAAAQTMLTLDDAVARALEHQPVLRSASAAVRSADAAVTQSQSAFFPVISSTGQFAKTDGMFVFNPSIAARYQKYDNYTLTLQGNWVLWDFGRTTGRVAANSALLDAARGDYEAARENTALTAALAYYGVMQARQVMQVNQEAVERARQHLVQAKAFVAAGRRPQYDVTKAEVDCANADVALIRSRNQLRLAFLQLENAMGVHPTAAYSVADSFAVEPFSLTLEELRSTMLVRRPELSAQQSRANASKSLASSVWSQHMPTVSAFGTYTGSNYSIPPLLGRANYGLSFSLPLFQGFSVSAQTDQAEANAEAADAALTSMKEALTLEAEQNYYSLLEAGERIAAASKLVRQSEESLTLAERQYAAGISALIDVTDAQLNLSNARIIKIQALYDYNGSLARLKRSMGRMIR